MDTGTGKKLTTKEVRSLIDSIPEDSYLFWVNANHHFWQQAPVNTNRYRFIAPQSYTGIGINPKGIVFSGKIDPNSAGIDTVALVQSSDKKILLQRFWKSLLVDGSKRLVKKYGVSSSAKIVGYLKNNFGGSSQTDYANEESIAQYLKYITTKDAHQGDSIVHIKQAFTSATKSPAMFGSVFYNALITAAFTKQEFEERMIDVLKRVEPSNIVQGNGGAYFEAALPLFLSNKADISPLVKAVCA
jgi:hypothetical protein